MTSFNGVLVPPAEIVLDTSFVAEALIQSQSRHYECAAFLQNLAVARSRVYYNRLLESELWEAAYRIAIEELHPRGKARTARQDGRTRKRAKLLRGKVEKAWNQALSALDSVCLDLDDVGAWVPSMMEHGLKSNDAVHAATACCVDVRSLATIDYGFASLPPETHELWVSANRVASFRQRRKALGYG